MGTALLGGLLIGFFVVGWLGVFVLPVVVAIYQCIALFFLIKRKGINSQDKIDYNPMKKYMFQFSWTYITTTAFAIAAHFIRFFF